jgi:myo-inositol-1(or 4)-monophosphatase
MPISPADLQARLDFALAAARSASDWILKYYQTSGLAVESKRDASPVTEADRGAERLLRAEIAEHFPGDGILGEEYGDTPGTNGFRWVLDPVDGTKSFIHGVPLFGTLIGLEFEQQCVLGVCRFPALDEVVYGAQGLGAWWQRGQTTPQRARVSNVSDLSQALFCLTTITGWDRIDRRATFDRLCAAAGLTRGWGDCYGHALVATGRADVMIDPAMNPWDAAALLPILQEAGGSFVDWNGKPTIYSGNGVSVNAALKNQILEMLRS